MHTVFIVLLTGTLAASAVFFAVLGLLQHLRTRALARKAHEMGMQFSSDDPFDLPCIAPNSPLTITARALEIPEDTVHTATAELSGALFGYWLRNLTGCSPISTLPLLGVGPMMMPSAYPAGPCPPTADMGGTAYGMPTPQ